LEAVTEAWKGTVYERILKEESRRKRQGTWFGGVMLMEMK
jgi:hypothetical protein